MMIKEALYSLVESCCILLSLSWMMPSQSPLWRSKCITNDCMIGLGNILRIVFHHKEHISESTGSPHFHSNISWWLIIFDIPILCCHKIGEYSKPRFIRCFCHEERMYSTLLLRCPQTISPSLHKQIRSLLLEAWTQQASEARAIFSSISMSYSINMIDVVSHLHITIDSINRCSMLILDINRKRAIGILIPSYVIWQLCSLG